MYCGKCGAKNPDEHQFCDKCGEALMQESQTEESHEDSQTEESQEDQQKISEEETQATVADTVANKKMRLIVGGLVAIAVIVVCVIAIGANTGGKVSPEYNEKIAEADRYLEELDYAKAETAYLEAIEIEPKVDDAYLKLADTYVVQEKYEDAVEILEEGQENAGGEEIQQKLEEVTPYSSYYDFLEAEVIPDVGLAAVDESFYWGENGGLVSALIQDINADEIPELLTVTYGNTKHTTLIMSLYTSEDGKVTLIDEYVEDNLGDEDYMGDQYELFLKEHEGRYCIVLKGFQVPHYEGICDILNIYTLENNQIDHTCEAIAAAGYSNDRYSINGEIISGYYFDDMMDYDEAEDMAAEEKGFASFGEALAMYGLSEKLIKNKEYDSFRGRYAINGYDENEPSEQGLLYLETGSYSESRGIDPRNIDLRFLSDYTDLRNKLSQ